MKGYPLSIRMQKYNAVNMKGTVEFCNMGHEFNI